MIFGWDSVSCDDFSDCHDEIAVAGVDFIGRRPICGLYLQGNGTFWEPPTRTATLGDWSHQRWSRREIQGLKEMNLHLMSYPTIQLPIFFQWFRCVLDWFRSVESYGMFNVLELVVGFDIRTVLWLRRSRKAIREEEMEESGEEYYVFLF